MAPENKKELGRFKRHRRIRVHLKGTSQRPRLVVTRSLNNLAAQLIDDAGQKTIFSLTTLDKEIKAVFPCAGNVKAADFFGQVFARRVKEKGFSQVVFDRAGFQYHGRVKHFAESLRKGGLVF